MLRFLLTRTLQRFSSLYASVFNHFNQHLPRPLHAALRSPNGAGFSLPEEFRGVANCGGFTSVGHYRSFHACERTAAEKVEIKHQAPEFLVAAVHAFTSTRIPDRAESAKASSTRMFRMLSRG